MNKAVFLDRDGTINVEKNYLYRIDDFEFLPQALDGMKMLYDAGYLLIIITNQSGIARGFYTEEDYEKLTDHMKQVCSDYGVEFTDILYCPHLKGAIVPEYDKECDCRKPATGLFKQTIEKYDIDLSESYAIGDKMRDLTICIDTSCRGYLIGGTSGTIGTESLENIESVESLYDAACRIVYKHKEG